MQEIEKYGERTEEDTEEMEEGADGCATTNQLFSAPCNSLAVLHETRKRNTPPDAPAQGWVKRLFDTWSIAPGSILL